MASKNMEDTLDHFAKLARSLGCGIVLSHTSNKRKAQTKMDTPEVCTEGQVQKKQRRLRQKKVVDGLQGKVEVASLVQTYFRCPPTTLLLICEGTEIIMTFPSTAGQDVTLQKLRDDKENCFFTEFDTYNGKQAALLATVTTNCSMTSNPWEVLQQSSNLHHSNHNSLDVSVRSNDGSQVGTLLRIYFSKPPHVAKPARKTIEE